MAAYPSNGGSYTVARENLGARAGLLAAAALVVDYMLNVAVGISAGVGEVAGRRWREAVLHTRRTANLRTSILRHGGPGVSVLLVPWQLEPPETARALEEEPVTANRTL